MTDHPPLTDAELDAITARADAATTGPWHWDGVDGPTLKGIYGRVLTPRCVDNDEGDPVAVIEIHLDDAALIAAGRMDIPRLVAEVRRLQCELSKAHREILRLEAVGEESK